MRSKLARAAVAAALCLALAPLSAGQKRKDKIKEKHFEPVARQNVRDYAGRYVGIEDDYVIEVIVGDDGELSITSREGDRAATLSDIRLDGAELTATKTYANGKRAAFSATFADRVLNGERAFGLLVKNLRIELPGMTLTQVFYRRVAE
ncbi:MAG: hypothetical protein LC746_16925 [Acidobacteria bacterium]|nr:hypothetical protein [Acidobacteriota bacterium]